MYIYKSKYPYTWISVQCFALHNGMCNPHAYYFYTRIYLHRNMCNSRKQGIRLEHVNIDRLHVFHVHIHGVHVAYTCMYINVHV